MRIKIDSRLLNLRVYSDLFKEIELSEIHQVVENGEDLLISPCPLSAHENADLYTCKCGKCQIIYPFLTIFNLSESDVPSEILYLMKNGNFACVFEEIDALGDFSKFAKYLISSKDSKLKSCIRINVHQNEMDVLYASSFCCITHENYNDRNIDFILINRAYSNEVYNQNFLKLSIFNDIDLRDSSMNVDNFLSSLKKDSNYVLYRREAS